MPLHPEDLRFGELAVAQGLCTPAQLAECVSQLERLIAQGAAPTPRLGEFLARRGYLTPAQLESTLKAPESRTLSSSASSTAALPAEAQTAAKDPGASVGKYLRVSLLGAGGMGEVWKGWDRELGRWVALKFLKHDDPQEALRFQREAQTAAGLSHPNIASVYEVGQAAGRPFLAMQLVAGRTLAAHPRNDVRKLVALVRDAALAVQHAHERGVVHRDLKPQNLMVEGDRIFVMDFGLAKQAAVDVSLSVSGAILGTPSYMAPEQARGESAKVGPASDVYALGATLYDLLADRPPFQAEEVYSLLKKVIEEEPVPLRRRSARADADLETIVQKCLEKDPARRYAGARDLAEELDRWLRGEAILAHPPSLAYRARKYVRRHKGIVAAAALGLVAVAVTLALLVPKLRSEAARADAERETRRRSEQELKELGHLAAELAVVREWVRQPFRKPEEIRGETEKLLARVSDFVGKHPALPQGRYIRARALLELTRLSEAERDLAEALRIAPDFAPARALQGRVHLERYTRAIHAVSRAERSARQKSSARLLDEAAAAFAAAGPQELSIERWGLAPTRLDAVQAALTAAMRIYYQEGRHDDAIARLRAEHAKAPSEDFARWLAMWVPEKEEEAWLAEAQRIAPHFAFPHLMRGTRRYRERKMEEAERELTRALELDPHDATLLVSRAAVHLAVGRLDEARRDVDGALKLDPGLAVAWASRAAVRLRKGDPAGCIADADEAVRLDPGLSLGWSNRAAGRIELARPEEAQADLAKALELDPESALAHSSLAAVALLRGDAAAALRHAERAVELDPELPLGYANRAGARLLHGESARVVEDCDRAIRLDPLEKIAWVNRAAAKLRLGDLAGAEADSTRAIELDPRVALAWVNRASARTMRGALDEAAADVEKALSIDPANLLALVVRASLRHSLGDLKGASEDLERVLAKDPTSVHALQIRTHVRIALRDLDGALADAERILDLAPGLPEGHCARGAARVERGEYKEAVADFDRVLQALPGNAGVTMTRGLAREGLGDAEGALRDYTAALELDPAYVDGWLRRGVFHLSRGDLAKAVADFDRCLALNPKQAYAWSNRGGARRLLGDLKGGVEDSTKAIALDPTIPEAWMNRGFARHKLKDREGAIADLRKALEAAPAGWDSRAEVQAQLDELLKGE